MGRHRIVWSLCQLDGMWKIDFKEMRDLLCFEINDKYFVIIFPLSKLNCFFGVLYFFISLVKENIAGLTIKIVYNVQMYALMEMPIHNY